jgi:hypothetical protein
MLTILKSSLSNSPLRSRGDSSIRGYNRINSWGNSMIGSLLYFSLNPSNNDDDVFGINGPST